MISAPEILKLIQKLLPSDHAGGVRIKLDATSLKTQKHLNVITSAWSDSSRIQRIKRVVTALHSRVPAEERRHILSVGVFSPEEWAERMKFARKLKAASSRPKKKEVVKRRTEKVTAGVGK